MKLKLKKAMAMVAVFMMVFSMSGLSTVSASNKKTVTPAQKPDKITFMIDGSLATGYGNGNEWIQEQYKKLTDITLDIVQPQHNEYYEKVNLAFAAGNIPDALVLSANNYLGYAANGMLADVTDWYDASEAKKHVQNQAIVDAVRVNGKLYGVPITRGNGTVTYVRGDWLDAINMDAPKNYNEFIDMLKAFKDKDLAGNKQTIPYTSAGLVNAEYPLDIYLREFYWTSTPDFYQDKSGVWKDGMETAEFRAALERMKTAYADGLIDKEIVTNKTSTCRDKFYAGNVGVFNYWAGEWNYTMLDNLKKTVPNGEIVPIPAIEETFYVERPAVPYCVTSKAKNPQGVFEYLIAYMIDGGEGENLFTNGVEGKTYSMSNNQMTMLPSKMDAKTNYKKILMAAELSITDFKNPRTFPDVYKNSLDVFRADAKQYGLLPSTRGLSKYQTQINESKTEAISKIVTTDLTVDKGLEDYNKKIGKIIDTVLVEMNKK